MTKRGTAARRAFGAVAVAAAALLAVLALPGQAFAWTGTATISGTVVDQAGAPVQTCVQAQTSTFHWANAFTDADGRYSLTVDSPDSWWVSFGCYGDPWIKAFWGGDTNRYTAPAIAVADGDSVTGIDVTLLKGGVVTGHVVDATGQPVTSGYVSLQGADGTGFYASGQTGPDGAFTVQGVLPGEYIVTGSTLDGQAFWHGTSWSDADHLLVAAGRTVVADIQFPLRNAISGRITDTAGNPIANECVAAETGPDAYGFAGFAQTGTDGTYLMKALPDGTYTIAFNTCSDQGHLIQYFDGAPDQAGATPLTVSAGANLTGIDAVLGIGGAITGTITGEDGAPIANACVSVQRTSGYSFDFTSVTADSAGHYRVPRINDADYFVHAGCGPDPYLSQWYGNGAPGDWSTTGAIAVHGSSTGEVSGIDIALVKGGAVEGTITSNGQPLQGACVQASGTDAAPYVTSSTVTDANGHYRVSMLAGDADLAITPLCSFGAYPDLVPEWYHDGLIKSQATPVSVTLGQTTTGIDEDLAVGGQISGTVTDSTGKPAPSVCATAVLDNFDVPDYSDVIYGNRGASSDSQGHFTIHALPPGSYHVEFHDCSGSTRFLNSTLGPFTVAGGQTTSGVDAVMVSQPPSVQGLVPTVALAGDSISLVGSQLGPVTEVDFDGTPSPSVTHTTDYQVDAVVPPGAAGSVVTVTASAPGWTSPGFSFTYATPAPVVTSIDPGSGPEAGGTSVTITGSHFTDASAVRFGGVDATSFAVVDDATISATAPAGTGSVAVSVTTPGGSSTGGPTFTYVPPGPVVVGLNPTTGPEAGGTTVKVAGAHFTGASAVTFGGVNASQFTVLDDASILATSPPGTGSVEVAVAASGAISTGGPLFTYIPPAPVVSGISPREGPLAGGTSVTITGSHLGTADGVQFGGVDAASFAVVDDATITATAPAGTGSVDVTVHGPGGTSAVGTPDVFTYRAAPVVTALSPDTGPTAGGTAVTISGRDFTGATAVDFGTTPATFTVVSDTQINAVTPPGTGSVPVTVTTAGGTSVSPAAPPTFSYADPPQIASVSPSRGSTAGGDTVTVSGQFLGSATSLLIDGVPVAFTVVDANTITAVTPAHARAIVDVAVTTPDGTATAAGAYRYVGTPLVTGVSPASGSKAGGTQVTLSGVDLVDVTSVVLVDRNSADKKRTAVAFSEMADGTIVFTTPAHHPGTVGIEVTTRYGTSPSSAASFTYRTV